VLLLTEMTDDESDYEIEYEVLSRGSDEPWEYVGVSCNELPSTSREAEFVEEQVTISNNEDQKHKIVDDDKPRGDTSAYEAADSATVSHSNDLTSETGTKEDVDCASKSVGHEHQHDENTSTSEIEVRENAGADSAGNVELDGDSYYGHEDLERLMCEIGSMRDSLRLLPDFQRREMAAKLAMKMAAMFGDSSDEDGNLD